jgi:hypothetical protein
MAITATPTTATSAAASTMKPAGTTPRKPESKTFVVHVYLSMLL